ncbi:RNA polymerase sigma factor sigF, chloroplastic [Olea europaea subsp. europaea]|uniref:RNA polymerase sigma factor sigF, chloroplastic n=1 Tax=Olea europaea subsp. europaea TaxID=158383 RepID=A0A8S0UAN3_OLEEU|nr:RNA polymerase sigma factor sigF, chloroplastic [Olea europaea subsp. europaea]
MASSSGERISGGFFESTNMARIYVEAGLPPPFQHSESWRQWAPHTAVDRFELQPCELAIVKAIYELSPEKRFFKIVIGRRSLFVTNLLMTTKEQHDRKEYVKLDMFFMGRLAEEKKKKPLGTSSSTYKNQRDELAKLSKLNLPHPLEKKREEKGKEKIEPSGGERKRRLVISRNEGTPPPPKRQTTIDESLKKPIKVEPISALKIIKLEEVAKEKGAC